MLVYWLNNKAGKLRRGMGALRLPISWSHSSLTLYDSPLVWLPCIVAITPKLCAACTLCVHCYHCVTLCCQPIYSSSRSLDFFKWDDSVDGVEQPPALDLHLVLSVSFFHLFSSRSVSYPSTSDGRVRSTTAIRLRFPETRMKSGCHLPKSTFPKSASVLLESCRACCTFLSVPVAVSSLL